MYPTLELWKHNEDTAMHPKDSLKSLSWLDLILAKGIKSKFGKAIVVIKDVISSSVSSHLLETRKNNVNNFSKQNKLQRQSPLSEKRTMH